MPTKKPIVYHFLYTLEETIWHNTWDMWWEVNILSKFQLPLEEKDDSQSNS